MRTFFTLTTTVLGIVTAGAVIAQPGSVLELDLTTNGLVYDPFERSIYATVPSSVGLDGNSVVPMDPRVGDVGTFVFVGSEPEELAISDDGSYLYVDLDGAAAVRRVLLPEVEAELQFPLGNDPFTGPFYAEDMEVAPGVPEMLAISRRNKGFSPKHEGVGMYFDGVALPDTTPDHTGSNVIEFSSSFDRLYGYNNETTEYGFRRMDVTEDGVAVLDTTRDLISGFFADIEYDAGRIYATTGVAIDPETRLLVGTYSGVSGGLVRPDSELGRVFFLTGNGATRTLHAFDLERFLPLATEEISGVSGDASHLIRWGADGLAFRTDEGQVFVLRTALVGPMALDVTLNRGRFAVGDEVVLGAEGVSYGGYSDPLDLFVGAIAPDGDTVYYLTPDGVGEGALSAPEGLAPRFAGISIDAPNSWLIDDLLRFTRSGDEASGRYEFFAWAVAPGSFGDGSIDDGDIVFRSTQVGYFDG